MKHRHWRIAGLAVLVLAARPLMAQEPATGPLVSAPAASPAGWAGFTEALHTLPERMLARLPEAQRRDPQVQQEVARLALAALASSAITALAADGDAPQFLPSIGQVLNVGQPNADTVYRSAAITPGGTYRLRGRRGTLPLAVIAQVVPQGKPGGGQAGAGKRAHFTLSSLTVDADGRFDVLLAPVRPAGHTGDFRELDPAATMLMVRMVSADWSREQSPTLAIERVDQPVSRPRRSTDDLAARLNGLPRQVDVMALMFVDHVAKLRAEGYVNRLKVLNVPFGALAGQFYYEGPYELADDEALVIDSPVPAKCEYRSLILTNELYETTDWTGNHSSLNDAQARPDSDGRLRIVVAPKDPGVKNWLDTAGYNRGLVQGRWTGCDSQPVPDVAKVKAKDLKTVLPKDTAMVTPEERQAIIRERRRAAQERPLW